jgi:RNA polymerase sigma-70 factor, ECF subfamily
MSVEAKSFDVERLFGTHYARIARMIGRVVRDRGRSEEVAVEVFLKLWRKGTKGINCPEAWIYRVAARAGLDELRRQTRRARYEDMFGWMSVVQASATPEDLHRSNEQQERVRAVLGALPVKQAQMLLLRSDGFRYAELAAAMGVNPASVGTKLMRAQEAFRKEYIRRYDEQ